MTEHLLTNLTVRHPKNGSPYRQLTIKNVLAFGRYLLLRARHPNIKASLFYLGSGDDITIDPRAVIDIGYGVVFKRDFSGHFAGHVRLGDGVFFNRGCSIVVLESLIIGDHSIFGERVSIHDENHVIDGTGPRDARGLTTGPIVIGRNVWVGAKATILQNVHIGDNAVIGANAVVTHDIPANSVAVGIPARVLRAIPPEVSE